MLSGQNTKRNKAAPDATTEGRVVMSSARVEWRGIALLPSGRRLAIIPDLSSGNSQMTIYEIFIAVLHCLSDCVLAYYTRSCKSCCKLGLGLASSEHMTHTRYHMISGHRNNRKVADSAINTAISPNRYEPY